MDRRSWLWRRNSSGKSPGETESSDSISSQSEPCSGEQAHAAHSSQSVEVTSEAVVADEDGSDRVKALMERLSTALLDITAKEELVKQHEKVAEEAVSGWEKAENEISVLKKQLESAAERNSSLEDRVSHLDGALKECLKQLRQSREEQEQRISEAIMEKARKWEVVISNLHSKLDTTERENSFLKSELLSRVDELEVRTIELDLSTKAAETASKQNLQSIKKVAKLEAEICRLKAMARKAASASSFWVESSADSQSDGGERLLAVENSDQSEFDMVATNADSRTSDLVTGVHSLRNEKSLGKSLMISSLQIDLMDDFLEVERLAGLPDAEAGSSRVKDGAKNTENLSRSDLDAVNNRTSQLEEEIEKKEVEKAELELALRQLHEELDRSETQLKEAEARQTELETRLTVVEELKGAAEEKMKATESQLSDLSAQVERLRVKVKLLEEELGSEQAEKAEKEKKYRTMEEEISRMWKEAELQQVTTSGDEMKLKQVEELTVAASKFAECQKTIASLAQKLKSLAAVDDFLVDSDKALGLMSVEDSRYPENNDGAYESDPSDLISMKRESDYSRSNFSVHMEKGRGGTFPKERSHNGLRKFSSQGSEAGNQTELSRAVT